MDARLRSKCEAKNYFFQNGKNSFDMINGKFLFDDGFVKLIYLVGCAQGILSSDPAGTLLVAMCCAARILWIR